jgi:hypothetical protein
MERESGNELPQSKTVAVEAGNRIDLPAEWCQALGLKGRVALDKTDEGILVRPCPQVGWDDIFANRLSVRPGDPAADPEISELRGDDLLF